MYIAAGLGMPATEPYIACARASTSPTEGNADKRFAYVLGLPMACPGVGDTALELVEAFGVVG